ncbi:MAG: nucleotidyltransferase domain-containing protein [Promethearchaeota archaeon]|jgi:predicted nucleotidyltransferase
MNDNMLLIKQIADLLAKNVPEIDLIILYGSFAHGLGHELSDYDLIIISDSKKVAWEFILNERPIQTLSLTWEYAEKVLTGEKGNWSTGAGSLANGIIVWEKSSKYRQKLERLIKKVNEGGRYLVKQTINFDDLYSRLWLVEKNIKNNKEENIRLLIWDLAIGICYRLSGLNNQYFLNNWGKQLGEIENFTIKPKNFSQRFEKLITSKPKEALNIAENLVDELHILYKNWLIENMDRPEKTYKEIIADWSSAVEGYHSIKSAYKKKDLIGGIYAATDFTEFMIWAYMVLQNKRWDRNNFYPLDDYIKRLPYTIQKDVKVLLSSNKLDELAKAAENVIEDFRQQLRAKNGKLPIAKTLEEALLFIRVEDR